MPQKRIEVMVHVHSVYRMFIKASGPDKAKEKVEKLDPKKIPRKFIEDAQIDYVEV